MPAIETSYITNPLTLAEFDGNETSFQGTKDSVLLAEEDFAKAIADTGNHPWRRVLNGITASIPHQGVIPSTDASSNQIIGIYGAIRDASDGTICTEMPLEVIRRRVRNANSFYRCASYFYKIDGVRIEHTRTNATIDVCVYNRTTQAALMESNGNMLLPDALESALVSRALSYLTTTNVPVPTVYRSYSDEAESAIRRGLTSVSSKSIPAPFQGVGAT